MKKKVILLLFVVWGCCAGGAWGIRPVEEGAAPGVWTMDFDAAKEVAAARGLPLLLNFTGSDWCGWCQLMEGRVFGEAEWEGWARENLLLVWIDFPRDKGRVPERYVARNERLAERYDVQGFPTFILLKSDGETYLGQLGASREVTPAKFILEIEKRLMGLGGGDISRHLSEGEGKELMELKGKKEAMEREFLEAVDAAYREEDAWARRLSMAEAMALGEGVRGEEERRMGEWRRETERKIGAIQAEILEIGRRIDELEGKALAGAKSAVGVGAANGGIVGVESR